MSSREWQSGFRHNLPPSGYGAVFYCNLKLQHLVLHAAVTKIITLILMKTCTEKCKTLQNQDIQEVMIIV